MQEFKPSSDSLNRKCRSSSSVPTLGIGNGGIRTKFRCLESEMEELENQVPTLGIGNGGVQIQVPKLGIGSSQVQKLGNREGRNLSQVLMLGIGKEGV